MRITYDSQADAAYISLTETVLDPGRDSIALEVPRGVDAMVIIDWKDGKIVGLEVLDAASLLHPDFLALAEPQKPAVPRVTPTDGGMCVRLCVAVQEVHQADWR